MPSRKLFINSSLAIVAIAPIVLYAIVPGPGYSGAPGDSPTGCITSGCHTGTPNSGSGSVQISASGGAFYIPGQTQQISVTITDATEKKYGFQLSPRLDSNPKTAAAGLLSPGKDGYTSLSSKSGSTLQWINHTVAGYNASNSTPGSYTYTFNWTPPSTDQGTVTLYAAGEAVTGADVIAGSETYLSTLQLSPGGQPPVITAVENAAGFTAGAPVASGSWVAIFGSNLGPETSVTVNAKPATIAFTSPSQVNIQAPDDAALGPVPVVVTTATGGVSAPFMVTYAKFAPGLFSATPPYIVAQHADYSYVSPASPAQPGEVIILWGTGFGPPDSVTATIGGQAATIQFAGVVGPGLMQINVQVPIGIASGDAPVVLSVAGVSTQTINNLFSIHP